MVAVPASSETNNRPAIFSAAPQRDLRRERRIAALAHPRQALLVPGDERQRCRKRHLETRVNDRFGCEQQHAERRDRERAEGERRAIDHHSDEDDADHDEGALGRNLRTRQQEIERRRGQRRERRPFLDGMGLLNAGMSANSARNTKNMRPATTAM
jgi:hypothetical protein